MIWTVTTRGSDRSLGIVNEHTRTAAQKAAEEIYGWDAQYVCRRHVEVRPGETQRATLKEVLL